MSASRQAGFGYAGGASAMDEIVNKPLLEIIPVAPQEHKKGEGFGGPVGAGYRHGWSGPSPSSACPRMRPGK